MIMKFDHEEVFGRTPELKALRPEMEKALDMLTAMAKSGNCVLVCGNGGSCSDSEHIAGELIKGFLKKRPLTDAECAAWEKLFGAEGLEQAKCLQEGIACRVLSSQTALMTAVLNDNDPALAYAQTAWACAKPGDVFIGISTSGNAKNVLAAARAAKVRGAKVIAMTGAKDSRLSEIADCALQVPSTETYRVQEYHIQVYHWLCAAVEEAMFEV